MARWCARWVRGKKKGAGRKRRGRGSRHCKYGVVKRGRRRGQCLKTRRARKRRAPVVRTGYRNLVGR